MGASWRPADTWLWISRSLDPRLPVREPSAMDLVLQGVRTLGVLGPKRKRNIRLSVESLRKSLAPKKALEIGCHFLGGRKPCGYQGPAGDPLVSWSVEDCLPFTLQGFGVDNTVPQN